MTPLELHAYDCGDWVTAGLTRNELTDRHGWVDVDTFGPLVTWFTGADAVEVSVLVVSSIVRVFHLLANPVPPTTGDQK